MVDLNKEIVYYSESLEIYIRLIYLAALKSYLARGYVGIENMLIDRQAEKPSANYINQKIFNTDKIQEVESWYEERGFKRIYE